MKKLIILISTLLLVASFFAGCSKQSNENDKTTEKKSKAKKSNEVVFSSGLWSVPSQREFIKRVIMKEFEKKTGIDVDYKYIQGKDAYNTVLVQRQVNNVLLDILTIHSGDMPKFIDSDYMEDLTPYMKEYFGDITIFPVFNNVTHKDGKVYFLPIVSDVYILIANKKALKYLPKGTDINDISWEEYVQWSHNIKKGEGIGKTILCGAPTNAFVYEFGAIELSYGAKFLDITTKPALKAWNILAELSKDLVPDVLTTSRAADSLMRQNGWLSIIHVADGGATYQSNPTQFVIAPVPKGSVGRGSIAGAFGLGIPKGAKHTENALKLMQFLLLPKIQARIAKNTGGFVPPVKQAFEFLGKDPEEQVIKVGLSTFETAIISGVPAEQYWDWNAVKIVFDTLLKNMIVGKGKVDMNMLNAAQKELNNLNKEKSEVYKGYKQAK